MKKINRLRVSTLLLTAAGFIQTGSAALVAFIIDNSQSQIAASGKVAGATFTAQGAGALTTSYRGSINADVSGGTIQFTGGSAIIAQNSGNWEPNEDSKPGNTAPANYGPKATVDLFVPVVGALRNIVLDLNSPLLPVTGGSFNGTNLVFSSTSTNAVLDYYSALTSGGSQALSGYATNAVAADATLSSNGGVQTLVIPIDATFSFTVQSANDTTVHLTGQIVATSAVAAPPIIHSLVVTNQNVIVTAENVMTSSQLLITTNLTNWSPANNVTTQTNELGWIIFTTPMGGPQAFFRVQE